ncbi:MAG TPA: patatin-like phospholipase family protein, partial [Xenococcaceae cyanobacterium]
MQSAKVGLALGGGGARGWAHIGVLRALEEAEIKIDYLAGTSVGALIGAVYVTGALDKLEKFANEITVDNLLPLIDVSFPNLGLIEGKQVCDFITEYLSDKTIEAAAIPFRCVATNFLLKEEVVFESGNLVDAIRASISIPGIFVPFKQENVYLVDGGVVNPVPVSVVKDMGAEIVIAVNLNKEPKKESDSSQSKTEQYETNDEASQQLQAKQQNESGIVQNLVERYNAFKNIFKDNQDNIDD